jgi:hypothetical protein
MHTVASLVERVVQVGGAKSGEGKGNAMGRPWLFDGLVDGGALTLRWYGLRTLGLRAVGRLS